MNPQKIFSYVSPVFDPNLAVCGVGCFVGDHFVTAGHVFELCDSLYVFYNNERIHLTPSILLKSVNNNIKSAKDEDIMDYAVFKVDGVNSPLRLSENQATADIDGYQCFTFFSDPESNGLPLRSISSGQFKRSVFNFFELSMDRQDIRKGNSGSPVIIDGIVYGILSGSLSEDHPEDILFQSAHKVNY